MSRTEPHTTLAGLRQVQETRIDVSARGGAVEQWWWSAEKHSFFASPSYVIIYSAD